MRICNTCGIEAVNDDGKCEYCPTMGTSGSESSGGADDITALLAGSVADVTDTLEGVGVLSYLQEIRDAELAGKARKGVLAAVDARTAALSGAEG
jgi:hypothetical protein